MYDNGSNTLSWLCNSSKLIGYPKWGSLITGMEYGLDWTGME